MSPDDDARIASAYAELARPTAPGADPVAAVRQRLRRRAQRRRGLVAAGTLVTAIVLGVGIHLGVTPPPDRSSGAGAGGGAAPGRGALPGPEAQSCAVSYDRKTLAGTDWAADATVTTIGRGRGSVTVDLDVHTWYRGGTGSSLEVRLPSPRSRTEDAPPTYDVGTRLLLSGARADGRRLPWGCGFTRYYDAPTAATWAKVFRR